MGQLGFFDAEQRLAALSAKGDPLEAIDRLVPWESFRAEIEAVVLTPDEVRKSSAGRKPIDAIVLFRMLVLQALNNLSDEQVEYQVRDRLSFTRFLRQGIEDSIPDATTLWLFREKLAKAGLIEKLFDRFDQHLAAKGYMARGGQMVDATIVPAPTQRNSRDENESCSATAPIARARSRSDCAPAASRAVFMCGPLASTRCRKRKRMQTATEAKFAPASSTCSQLSRPRWAAGSCAPSASCERAPKLACRTWPTTFAAL
jgi:hypothetical protein